MSNNRLELPRERYSFKGNIVFSVTPKWYNSAREIGLEPDTVLRSLSAQRHIYVANRKSRNGNSNYYMRSPFGYHSFIFTDEKVMLLRHVEKIDVEKNNLFVKAGIQVYPDGNLIVCVRNRNESIYVNYVNGQQQGSDNVSASADVAKLIRWLDSEPTHDENQQEIQEEPLNENLLEFLECAKQYALINDELEKATAQSENVILYQKIIPSDNHERIDKIAYTFHVSEYNQETYKEGATLRLEAKDGKQLTASLLKAEESVDSSGLKPIYTITLLFNEQIDISQLEQMGNIRLDYSSVQLNVQLAAIDSIKDRTANSKYMNRVLGAYQPLPLQKKDLRSLRRDLEQKKYPPNASQIEAIEMGINSSDIALVLGPPGTGKTTVILEWVRYFVIHEKKRVLISSQNNKAVDNVLERLAQEKGIETIRAGKEDKIQANIRPYMFESKLRQLQKKVEKVTTEKLSLLYEIINNTEKTRELCKILINELNFLNDADSKLSNYIQNQFNTYIQQLQVVKENFNKLNSGYKTVTSQLNDIVDWLSKYKKSNGFVRFLKKIKYNKLIKQLPEFYNNQVSLYWECIQTKNHFNEQRQTIINELWSNQVIIQTVHLMIEHLSHFEQRIPNVSFNGIIPDVVIENIYILDIQYLYHIEQEIAKSQEKISLIKQAVYDWQQHISSQTNYTLSDVLLGSANLVGATCVGINSNKRFSRIDFDVTIIDEAGQIQIHNALVPMSRSAKLIMLGDHLQIPPSVDDAVVNACNESDCDTELLYKSLFEKLYNEIPEANKKFLDTQYRMPGQIADTISEWFYRGKYKSFRLNYDLKPLFPQLFNDPFAVVTTSDEFNRFEEKVEGGGSRNHFEAKLIVDIIKRIIEFQNAEGKFDYEKIGIISAYKSQVALIRTMLAKQIPSIPMAIAIEMVATLDSYQGQERDIIIYSCTKSNKKPEHMRRIGFLNELRRLNVAMSRCKKQLVFIGDMDFLSSCKFEQDSDIQGAPRISEKDFSRFITLVCNRVKNGNGEFISSKKLLERLANRRTR